MQDLIVLNPNCAQFKKSLDFCIKEQLPYVVSKSTQSVRDILTSSAERYVFAGGDGTLNNAINQCLILKKKPILGILPCGRANDCAKNLGIHSLKDYYKLKRTKQTDCLKVNDHFFITGGGIGLIAQTLQKANASQHTSSLSYTFAALSLMIKGYSPINEAMLNDEQHHNLMLIAVMNQSFIGRYYSFAPHAKNDDRKIHICILPKPSSLLGDITTMVATMRAKLPKTKTYQSLTITLKEKLPFIGDGEILCTGSSFNLSVATKAITLMTPQ